MRNFSRLALTRSGRNDARLLIERGPHHNPFYHKGRFYQARYDYRDGMEGASAAHKQKALSVMRELFEMYPENRVLQEYVGEPIPWGAHRRHFPHDAAAQTR